MKLVQRKYQNGDELHINKLYKLITGRDRTIEQYRWEWIDTWDGQGSIWLGFDEDRGKDDQLVMQYSLIPTPFSVWGNSYLAGKTENCMSHPDLRGTGLYFPHEKKYFEKAQKRFQIFFTTAGGVAKGAAGAVRRKLGYLAFDEWTQYVFPIPGETLKEFLFRKLTSKRNIPNGLAHLMSVTLNILFSIYFNIFKPAKQLTDIQIINKANVSLDEIENLWNRNKKFYKVTVDRNRRYLEWRINQNPYKDYQYVICYDDNKRINGSLIFSFDKNNVCWIEDVLVENINFFIFGKIISRLIWHAKEMNAPAVACSTLIMNEILKKVFKKSNFIDFGKLKRIIQNEKSINSFHVYISPDLQSKEELTDPRNWYVTDLFSEGRND